MSKPEEKLKNDRFVVDDDKKADWALEKIKELKEEQEEKRQLAQERMEPLEEKIATIERWRNLQIEQIQSSIDYFEGLLTEYAMQKKEDDPDLKTHSLPFGKLKFRKRRPKWNYDNEELLNSIRESGFDELLRIKESVDKRKLKKDDRLEVHGDKLINTETGEVIEGVRIQERGEKFKIDVEGVD